MNSERSEPPVRVRVTGLQEAQLQALVALEAAASAARLEAGVPPHLVETRDERAIVALRRNHDVRVLEADHEPAGYLAWRDEAPGVAVLEAIVVSPNLQRYGLATRLLREVGEKATEHGIANAVIRCPSGDRAAQSFLAKRGFASVDEVSPPDAVTAWAQQTTSDPGTEVWWSGTNGLGTIPGLPPPKPLW